MPSYRWQSHPAKGLPGKLCRIMSYTQYKYNRLQRYSGMPVSPTITPEYTTSLWFHNHSSFTRLRHKDTACSSLRTGSTAVKESVHSPGFIEFTAGHVGGKIRVLSAVEACFDQFRWTYEPDFCSSTPLIPGDG